jgi:serine protease Do
MARLKQVMRVKGAARPVAMTVAAALCAASTLSAQSTQSGTSSRPPVSGIRVAPTRTYTVVTSGNPCGQSETTDMVHLARLPEGLALLRMRSELDAASRLQALRPSGASDAPAVLRMQREVDSLTRVVEAVAIGAPRRADAALSELEQRRAVTLRVRQLAPQVDEVVESALARVARPAPSAPAGYLGVTLSSVPLRQSLQQGYIVSYCDYPVVEAVDPGSPAERAGLQAGDTIIAFNGQDVRTGMVDYTSLLTPNTSVRVRTQRSGRTRDFAVQVQPRTAPAMGVRVYARSPSASAPTSAPPVPVPPSAMGFVFERSTAGSTLSPGRQFVADSMQVLMSTRADEDVSTRWTLRAPRPGAAPASPVLMSFFSNADDAMLFGAQLKSLNAELRSALSLPEGVLVLQVLRGTPAADAGLRDGDVIRAANGVLTRRVTDIRVVFERSEDARSMQLRVLRGDEGERTVVMRW